MVVCHISILILHDFYSQSYTQYIPLPISDLDSWLKTPSIYVFDCSAAGLIVNSFIEVFTQDHVYGILYKEAANVWVLILPFFFCNFDSEICCWTCY